MTDREAILIMKNKRNKLENGYTDCSAEYEAINKAIDALVQRESNMLGYIYQFKPVKKDKHHYYCGNCGKRLRLKLKPNFCHKCGGKIEWEKSPVKHVNIDIN